MQNKYYILESSYKNNNKNINKKYYVTIINNYEAEEYIINIGGINIKCITIQIPYKSNQGVILDISYYEKCCIKDKLKKNKDMVHLIKCSLIFTLNHFPQITSFILSDNSYIECNNKTRLSLAELYYIKYKKTWYEKMFNAIHEKKEKYKEIKINIDKILNKKLKLDTNTFLEAYYNGQMDNIEIINTVRENYKKNMTLKSFFEKMMKYECSYYSIIFMIFIQNQLKGSNWIIKINDIANYNSECNLIPLEKPLSEHRKINNISLIERRHRDYSIEMERYYNQKK
jgi:hypothetical protein